jgi:catechol 2,3-dioxygenase-like lactoylglutathione lyase family enzyme
MEMTKPYLDFGLQSDRGEAMQAFWDESIGLALKEILPVYDGVDQYRYALRGAVLKLNVMAQSMAPAPRTGYRRLIICSETQRVVEELVDPDGNVFLLAPRGYLGKQELALEVAVCDKPAFRDFYGQILGLSELAKDTFAWGNTQLRLVESADAVTSADDLGPGLRYITFQVGKLDQLHARLMASGVTEHMPPTQWNEMSYVSFIRDPDSNLIELSQRADLG